MEKCVRNAGCKTWIYCYNSVTKHQSPEWISISFPYLNDVRHVKSNINNMLVIIMTESIVPHEFVFPDQMVNQH